MQKPLRTEGLRGPRQGGGAEGAVGSHHESQTSPSAAHASQEAQVGVLVGEAWGQG